MLPTAGQLLDGRHLPQRRVLSGRTERQVSRRQHGRAIRLPQVITVAAGGAAERWSHERQRPDGLVLLRCCWPGRRLQQHVITQMSAVRSWCELLV